MNWIASAAVATLWATGSTLVASPVLHFDVNGITVQVTGSGDANSPFGGLNHTGSLKFGFEAGTSYLQAISIQSAIGGLEQPQTVVGQLTNFVGQVDLVNGVVTGGQFRFDVGSDFYRASIVPNSGSVAEAIIGGYSVEGLTVDGEFSGGQFAGVDIAEWFGKSLLGSFLQFNFRPDETGFSFADVDIFVHAVPVPQAAWAGLAGLVGVGVMGYRRSRR